MSILGLTRLPYFNPIRIRIIDPMHNLILGTAKRLLKKVWLGGNIIKKNHALLFKLLLIGLLALFLPLLPINLKLEQDYLLYNSTK